MRIVLAPDSFKESMTASQAAAAMARGVGRVLPAAQCVELPIADGGEGTLLALAPALGAGLRTVATTDPMGRSITASFGITPEALAVIEAAAVVGLALVPISARDVEHATTLGLAAVLNAAADAGAKRVIIGVGGTATSDGGAGLLVGLGARLLDRAGRELRPNPAQLTDLASVDLSGLDPRLSSIRIDIAADVTNPLLGRDGAVAVFGPQKGATAAQLPRLEAGLSRLAVALVAAGAPDVKDLRGAGAGGGLGAALLTLGGRMTSGIELVAEAVGLPRAIAAADLVLTGEGSLDAQTGSGKALAGVLGYAAAEQVPVIAFAGRVADPTAVSELGFAEVVSIVNRPMELAEALVRGPELLADAVAETLRSRYLRGR